MKTTYRLDGSSVLYKGREELYRAEVSDALLHALRRKLRLERYDKDFFQNLTRHGEASISWNFTRHNSASDKHWVSFHAWLLDDLTYHLHCVGPQAEMAIERINRALDTKTPKWLKKKLAEEERRKQPQSKRSRKKKERLKKKRQNLKQAPRKKEKRGIFASHQHEQLTVQFRKSRVSWLEALNETVAIFQVHRDSKNSAREIVARKLWNSLERNDYRFAQFRQEGFCLQFTLVDGRWRGDITPLTVSCTKDNRHPTYRRMRKRLKAKLQGLSPQEQRRRKLYLWPDERQAA